MLNNMKISSRLIAMLVSLLVLVVVVGGVGLVGMSKVNDGLHTVYDDRTVPLMDLGLIIDMANRIRTNAVIAANAIQTENAVKANTDTVKLDGEIDTLWKKYIATTLTTEEKQLADNFGQQWKIYRESRDVTMNRAMEGDFVTAKENARQDAGPKFTAARETLFNLIALQGEVAKQEYEAADSLYELTSNIAFALTLIGGGMGIFLGYSIIRGINRSVNELGGVMTSMAKNGDLNVRAKVYGKDEIGQAATAFNGLIDGFATIIRQVSNGAGTVSGTAAQLSASSLQIAQGSQLQSEAAASTAAAVEEITVSINSVAANSEDVRNLSEKSLQQTRQGNQDVTQMIGEIQRVQQAVNQIADSVKEFVESTRAIAGMTQQVKDIADQTNLLALNAAIEAARAGEQGRGFAVVADEVRKLAEKSAKSANEIDLVTNSLNQKSGEVEATVQQGLRSLQATQEQVERVSGVLTEAGESVLQSSHGVSDIAASVVEQSLASTEIARNVEKIAQMSEENHAAVESNTQDIVRLEQLAKELQTAVSHFRV
ncbi:MAG: methyl-accepting chemotaxis protein [Gallionella sp.]|nr:methyl-accepting chemotaxis protein [Gallionella sp.]MDP1940938.1 methyl-accepting chemotaxis protein [Gallionella sp.]